MVYNIYLFMYIVQSNIITLKVLDKPLHVSIGCPICLRIVTGNFDCSNSSVLHVLVIIVYQCNL
jgi:hypothetical protein